MLIILDMWMRHSLKMHPTVFGRGQRLSEVTAGESRKTLKLACIKQDNIGMMNTCHTWYRTLSYNKKDPCYY